MDGVFNKKLRQARVRCALDVVLRQIMWVGLGAGGIALLAVLIERLLALEVMLKEVIYAYAAIAGGLMLILCWIRRPKRMQVSLLLDERLGLHERLSTALALEAVDDPFVRCAREEALERVQAVKPAQCIPIRAARPWWGTLLIWAVFLAVFLWFPQKDLLGLNERKEEAQQEKAQIELAEKQIKDATATVKLAADKLEAPELKSDLAGLSEALKGAEPQAAKRQVIRKLGDMSDKLNSMRNSMENQSMDLMQQMMRQLRASPNVMSQQLQMALARGQFSKAATLMRQLQQQMMRGEMNEQQKQALQQQLKNLAKQIQELAQKKDALEDELEKQGLDRKLAALTPEQLKKALQKKGLKPEQIDELMQKMAACKMASSRASRLGQALGSGAGGMGGEDLSDALAALDELGDLNNQAVLSEAMLAEIEAAIACLGEGMCQGLGGQFPYQDGYSNRQRSGSGPPGMGFGPRATDEDGQTAHKKTVSKSKTGQGPVVASWYFQGEQIKGQAARDYTQAVQDAGAAAAEAINSSHIPKKYEKAVKSYFGQLEEKKSADPNE